MQAMSRGPLVGELWDSIQTWLFPVLEDELGELDDKHRQFVSVCELCAPQDHMATYAPFVRMGDSREGSFGITLSPQETLLHNHRTI